MPTWSRRRRRSAIADPLDAERRLALSYVGAERRAPVETLWILDASLGQILSSSSQPIAAQLRLAWWRDALRRLDEHPAPAEPMLQAVQKELLPRGVSGVDLSSVVDGWEHLLAAETLGADDLADYGAERGGTMFRLTSHLLEGASSASIEAAGAAWALADLARHSSKPEERAAAIGAAAALLGQAPRSWPSKLRPLGMLTILAGRDARAGASGFEPLASPRRMMRMLAHRLTGR